MSVHETAVLDPGVRLGVDVEIAPYAVLGDGDQLQFGPYTVNVAFVDEAAAAAPVAAAAAVLLAVLTNVVSNNAAAVIGTPIAVSIAGQLGLPAEPFVLAVLFGANMSYATPMAYKTNLLVMSAGNYTFREFVKVGVPLSVLMWLTLTFVLSSMYL